MGYPREEQETTLIFDYVEREWSMCTYCPIHITKLKKLASKLNIELTILEEENGKIIGARCKLPEKSITFREPAKRKELTEEQRKIISDRMKKTRIDSKPSRQATEQGKTN